MPQSKHSLCGATILIVGSLLTAGGVAIAEATPPAAPTHLRIDTPLADAPACSNGHDDDADGYADYPDDTDCNTPNDSTEAVDGDGFPSPETTGWRPTGVALTPYTGPTSITTAGTVIDGKEVAACLDIKAANVTIRRSWVHCANGDGTWVIHHSSGANLLIEDTEVSSGAPTEPGDPSWCPTCTTRAIFQATNASMTVRRCYLHNTEAGIAADGGNVLAEYNWIGGNANRTQDNSGQHTTAFKSNGGSNNVVGRYNTLRCEKDTNCSSAISFYEDFGINDGVTLEGNLIAADGGYCLYGWYHASPSSRNMRITNNRFSTELHADCGLYGARLSNGAPEGVSVWWNNRWYDERPTGNKNKQLVDPDESTMPCADGIDNDSDGLVDYPADPGCTSAADSAER